MHFVGTQLIKCQGVYFFALVGACRFNVPYQPWTSVKENNFQKENRLEIYGEKAYHLLVNAAM